MIDRDRGTGRTTKQMQGAPQGAIFVWCTSDIGCARHLAHRIGRDDLQIERPSFFVGDRWRGLTTPIIVDHAFMEINYDREVLHGYRLALEYALHRAEKVT